MERIRTSSQNLIKTAVVLTPEQDALLDAIRDAEGVSRSAALRRLLDLGAQVYRRALAKESAA